MTFTNNAAGPTSRTVATGVAVTIETVGKASAPIVMPLGSYEFLSPNQRVLPSSSDEQKPPDKTDKNKRGQTGHKDFPVQEPLDKTRNPGQTGHEVLVVRLVPSHVGPAGPLPGLRAARRSDFFCGLGGRRGWVVY